MIIDAGINFTNTVRNKVVGERNERKKVNRELMVLVVVVVGPATTIDVIGLHAWEVAGLPLEEKPSF